MKKQTIKTALFSLVAAALVAMPATVRAAEDKPAKPAAPEHPAAPPKVARQPFHGKVDAVDTAKMTLTVGSLTLNITSETKITKDGKPATLSEIAVGDMVGGSAKKDDAGKLTATTIRAGEKPKAPKKPKKAEMPEAPAAPAAPPAVK